MKTFFDISFSVQYNPSWGVTKEEFQRQLTEIAEGAFQAVASQLIERFKPTVRVTVDPIDGAPGTPGPVIPFIKERTEP